jgi:anti-anti-sigma factor
MFFPSSEQRRFFVSDAIKEVTTVRLPEEVLNEDGLRAVQKYLEQLGSLVIHLDLGGIRFLTARGLGALVFLNRELRSRGGALVLVNVLATIYELLALTRLVEVLDVRAKK